MSVVAGDISSAMSLVRSCRSSLESPYVNLSIFGMSVSHLSVLITDPWLRGEVLRFDQSLESDETQKCYT